MTLHQLGRYRVQAEDRIGSGEDALRAMAEEQHLDFIIYGTMSTSGSGGIDCVLSVFDRAKGKTALSQSRKAAGVLDIFDTMDDLVVSVLESMTGAHIGFGSLTLENTGEKGSYTVLVDGVVAGENLTSLDQVLNGPRTVTIVQKRMLGESEIARLSVDVKEGETANFSFAVPLLMDDEKRKVEGLQAAIEAEWNDATATGDVDAKTMELSSLFGDLSYSPRLSTYKDEATELAGEWVLEKTREAIEGSAWEPKVELLDAAGAVSAGAKAYPNPAKIQKEFEDEAQLMETLFELQAGNALAGGYLNKGLECFGNALTVSIRYLSGNRMTDYAYALTMLQSFQKKAVAQDEETDDSDLKMVFGNSMRAGQLFYCLKNQVASGKTYALVASDFGKTLSVDGSSYEEAPASMDPGTETRTLNVLVEGEEKPIAVAASVKTRLLFVQDGFEAFGKIVTESTRAPTVAAKKTPVPLVLQRGSIRLRGRDDDWIGIKPIFYAAESTTKPQISGSLVTGGSLCRDKKYLYCRIDFGNGKLTLARGSCIRLELINDSTAVVFGIEAFAANNQGGGSGTKYVTLERVSTPTDSHALEIGSSAEGKSFVELSMPLVELSRYFDFSKPIKARLAYATGPTNGWYGFEIASSSPYVDIVLGDRNSDSAAAPSSAPKLRVTHAFGSISLTMAIDGTLYLDGVSVGQLYAGDNATLDSVKVGDRSVRIAATEIL
jgi:hypothetical protein